MSTLLYALLILGASTGDQVLSGPKVGEKVPSLKVLAYSGADAGKEVKWLEDKKNGPTVIVFVHEVTRPGFRVLKAVDTYATELAPDGLKTHFIWLTADKTKTEQWLNNAKNSLNFQSPIGITLDGQDGPANYGLNNMAKLTILVADKGKVVANFAWSDPNDTDAPKVTAAIAKVMGKKAPTPRNTK